MMSGVFLSSKFGQPLVGVMVNVGGASSIVRQRSQVVIPFWDRLDHHHYSSSHTHMLQWNMVVILQDEFSIKFCGNCSLS